MTPGKRVLTLPPKIDRQSPEIALILRGSNAEFKSARSAKITSSQPSIAMSFRKAYAAPLKFKSLKTQKILQMKEIGLAGYFELFDGEEDA